MNPRKRANVWEPTPHYIFTCPHCKRPSEKMRLINNGYIPTAEQMQRRPDLVHIGSERLGCPCGQIVTWYDLEQVMDSIVFRFRRFPLQEQNNDRPAHYP